MSSEYFIVQFIVFLYFCFGCIFTLPSPRLTTAAIVPFSIVSTEPIPEMKNLSETESQLLHKTAPVLITTIHEKEVAGHCPRYIRDNTMLEVKIGIFVLNYPLNTSRKIYHCVILMMVLKNQWVSAKQCCHREINFEYFCRVCL